MTFLPAPLRALPGLVAAALAFATPAARAEEATAEAGAPASIGLDIKVIAAGSADAPSDPKLELLLPRLKPFPFKSFKLLAENAVTLALKSEGTVALPGNRTLVLKPKRFEKNGRLRMGVNLKSATSEQVVQADVAVQPGGDVLIGGPKSDGDTLLIYVRHARTTQQ